MTNPERQSLIDRLKAIEERLLVIVNPVSRKGGVLASRVRSMVRREGMDLEETSTDHPDDIGSTIQFWSKRFGGSRVIMVFGGDGAINQVVNNVMLSRSNKNVVLAPVPAGTANDFCRAMGLMNPDVSLQALVDFNLKSVDLIKMEVDGYGSDRNLRYCSNILGIGLDGDLANRSQKYTRFGVPGYWYASLKQALFYLFKGVPAYHLRIKAEGFEYDGPAICAMFSNIDKYGHDLRIAPGAKLDDGMLHCTVGKPMNAAQALVAAILLVMGQHHRYSSRIMRFKCKEAEIEILDDVHAQEDGEVCPYPTGTKIGVSLERQALNVLSPPEIPANVP